jgi:hypothetical protein
MPRKKRDLEEEEETTTTAAGDELDTEDDTALSVEDRLAAIEEDLAEIKQLLSPDGQAEKDRNATMERHRKVPYIPPALPPGLSPNELVNHPAVKLQSGNPTEPVAPMPSETEPASIE